MASLALDWKADGKQAAYLHIPHSSNDSAWQSVRIPFFMLRNGVGPTTLLLGGCHGDEYEGPVALARFVHEVDLADVRGTILIVPAINLPAVRSGTRLSPLDGLNLNREFPGNQHGTVTQRIAHFLSTEIIPRCDAVVDIHSGGRSLNFLPCTFIHLPPDGIRDGELIEAARSFGCLLTVIVDEPHASVMIDDVVEKAGKLMIATELGGGGTLTLQTASLARSGILRLLHHLGNYEGEIVPCEAPSRLVQAPDQSYYVHADFDAILEPAVALGDTVAQDQTVGFLHVIGSLDVTPVRVVSPREGVVLCLSGQGLVRRDDTILVIAADYQHT